MTYLPAIAGLIALAGLALTAVGVWLASGGARVDELTADIRDERLADIPWTED